MENSDLGRYVCTSSLLDFCRERRGPSHASHIPLLICLWSRVAYHRLNKEKTNKQTKNKNKNKKSMGPDNMPAHLLKLALPYIVEPLTYKILCKTSVFPKILKTARVVPLPKNTDRSDPDNFRPISLLSALSKSRLKSMCTITYHISCGEIHLSNLNSLHCCAAKLLIPIVKKKKKKSANRRKTESSLYFAVTQTSRI